MLRGLLKSSHLLRCAANLVNRRTQKYASFLGFCAPCTWPLFEQTRSTSRSPTVNVGWVEPAEPITLRRLAIIFD